LLIQQRDDAVTVHCRVDYLMMLSALSKRSGAAKPPPTTRRRLP